MPASVAELSVRCVTEFTALWAADGMQLWAHSSGKLGSKNPRRHGNDGVTHNHHHACNRLSYRSFGRDVAITHGRQSHNRPINRQRNTGVAVLRAFDHIHDRAKNRHKQ